MLSPSIPAKIRDSLEEADKCIRSGAFTAAVAMTGRALEAMCRHFGTKSDVLAGGLKELLDREIIDKRLFQWGDELRINRNLAAHATGERFHGWHAGSLFTFALAICNYVFVLNEQFAEFLEHKDDVNKLMKQLVESLRGRKAKRTVVRGNPKRLWTLGHPSRRTQFRYEGSVADGCMLLQVGNPKIEASFFQAALMTFSGREVRGGFKEDDPPRDSFGEWIKNNSRSINGRCLTPRHASFIAAILCHETGVTSRLDGASTGVRALLVAAGEQEDIRPFFA
jgi:hypothetical protein